MKKLLVTICVLFFSLAGYSQWSIVNIGTKKNYSAPQITFSADTIGYCGVNSAEVQFSNTTQNAVSYLWDFGDGMSSSIIQPSHTYTACGIYTVKLKACSISNECDSVIKTNYITVTNVSFIPNIVASSNIPVCSGDTNVLSCTNVSSGIFKWFNMWSSILGATSSSYKATYDSDFYLYVINNIGCGAYSNTITSAVEDVCVWPGDANNSSQVDNYDLLSIGLFYNQTGAARAFTSNVWQQSPVADWGMTQYGGWSDIKHADCNGDGIINDADTLAILQNFSLTHAKNIEHTIHQGTQNSPVIYLSATNVTYHPGDWVDIDVNMGTAVDQVSDFYGVAFSFNYDYGVEPSTMRIIYPNSWISFDGANKLGLSKNYDNINTVYGAVTKTNQYNSKGYGVVAKLHFQISSQLSGTSHLGIYIENVYLIDSTAISKSVSYDLGSNLYIYVTPTSLVEQNDNNNMISISPNPFLDKTIVSYSLKKQSHVKIELVNIIGEIVILSEEENQESGTHKFELSSKLDKLSKGVYVIKCYIDNNVYSKKLIKQ